MALYALTGELVYQADLEGKSGINSLEWALVNKAHQAVASGLYLYLLRVEGGSGEQVKTGKVLVIH